MSKRLSSTSAGMWLLLAAPAHAGLLGHTVKAEWLWPSAGDVLFSQNLVVGAGTELPSVVGGLDIDIGDDYVRYDFSSDFLWGPQAFNGFRFTDLTGGVTITSYTIGSVSPGIAGLDAADLGFTATAVLSNFGASGPGGANVVVAAGGGFIQLEIGFLAEETETAPPALPSPGTLAALGAGLTLLGFARLRSRRARGRQRGR